ncbi:hypothetical protein GWI33_022580 [Rhynchophorus ferrugineus]|uniref:Uncharacterized protein n=1 Tax=Rhynchophorus ferrugineus TaxID=354439 RepID=A0A834IQK9_RHYFE|nr:hypothetical protein GWI33_022580 [Rhynchophorus ferrugineus]
MIEVRRCKSVLNLDVSKFPPERDFGIYCQQNKMIRLPISSVWENEQEREMGKPKRECNFLVGCRALVPNNKGVREESGNVKGSTKNNR